MDDQNNSPLNTPKLIGAKIIVQVTNHTNS